MKSNQARRLLQWIADQGGLKRSRDLRGEFRSVKGGVARRVFRSNGQCLDELTEVLAQEWGTPPREMPSVCSFRP
jgi:hypothetical protein